MCHTKQQCTNHCLNLCYLGLPVFCRYSQILPSIGKCRDNTVLTCTSIRRDSTVEADWCNSCLSRDFSCSISAVIPALTSEPTPPSPPSLSDVINLSLDYNKYVQCIFSVTLIKRYIYNRSITCGSPKSLIVWRRLVCKLQYRSHYHWYYNIISYFQLSIWKLFCRRWQERTGISVDC